MKITSKNMLVPLVVAMTALSAKGEGVRSLRGDVGGQSAGQREGVAIESLPLDAENLPEGERQRVLGDELPRCNCWANNEFCSVNGKRNGTICKVTAGGCGWVWYFPCTGLDLRGN